MPAQRLLYGWYDPNRKAFLVSRYPADSPVRPALEFESLSEAQQMVLIALGATDRSL